MIDFAGPYQGYVAEQGRRNLGPAFCYGASKNCWVRNGFVVPRRGWYRCATGLVNGGPCDTFSRQPGYPLGGQFVHETDWFDRGGSLRAGKSLYAGMKTQSGSTAISDGDSAEVDNDAGNTLTDANGEFKRDDVAAGDTVTIVSGTGATPGTYTVSSVTSKTVLVLDSDPGDSGGVTDVNYHITRGSAGLTDKAMGWNMADWSKFYSTGNNVQYAYYEDALQYTVEAEHEITGNFVVAQEPDAWDVYFRVSLRATRTLDPLFMGDEYIVEIKGEKAGADWVGNIYRRNADTETLIDGPDTINTQMDDGGGERKVPFRIVISGTGATVTVDAYIGGDVVTSTKTLTVGDTNAARVTDAGYVRLSLTFDYGSDISSIDEAVYFGYDDIGLVLADSAGSARVHALAVLDAPDVSAHGPSFSDDRVLLAYVGHKIGVDDSEDATFSFTQAWGVPSEPTEPPVSVQTADGLLLADGTNPPVLTNGYWYWQVGMEPPFRAPDVTLQADGLMTDGDTYEFCYSFYNVYTGEESPPSAVTSITTTTGNQQVAIDLEGPVVPQATHFRVYRRNTANQTRFYRIKHRSMPWRRTISSLSDASFQSEYMTLDNELPTDAGLPPYLPYTIEQHGGRTFYVGSEWRELASGTDATVIDDDEKGNALSLLDTDDQGVLDSVVAGDLLYLEDTGETPTVTDGYYYISSVDAASKWLYLNKASGAGTGDINFHIFQLKKRGRSLRWSAAGKPCACHEDNGADLDGQDDTVAVRSFHDTLVIFRRNSIWGVVGDDPDTWLLTELVADVGCVAPLSIVEAKGLLYFAAEDGLHAFNGRDVMRDAAGRAKPLSEPIADDWSAMKASRKKWMAAVHYEELGCYLLAYPGTSSSTDNDRLIAFDYSNGNWSPPWEIAATCFATMTDSSGRQVIFFGRPDGKIGKFGCDETGAEIYMDQDYEGATPSANITWAWLGGLTEGDSRHTKRIIRAQHLLEQDSDGTGETVTCSCHFDDATATGTVAASVTAGSAKQRVGRRVRSVGQKCTATATAHQKVRGFNVDALPVGAFGGK